RLFEFRFGHAPVSLESDHLSVKPVHSGESCLAQSSRAPNDSLKDRLQISWGAGNHTENFPCRRLLLQRLSQIAVAFLQFLEQPHVFDGDYGLVGEGLQKVNLLVGEWTDLGTADQNRANCGSFPH